MVIHAFSQESRCNLGEGFFHILGFGAYIHQVPGAGCVRICRLPRTRRLHTSRIMPVLFLVAMPVLFLVVKDYVKDYACPFPLITRLSDRDRKRIVAMLDDSSSMPNEALVKAVKRYRKQVG